jgi:ribonuclease HI/retron-type reverse transcriptase
LPPLFTLELTTGPWGADEGGRQLADRSPVEQQASTRGKARLTDIANQESSMGKFFDHATEQTILRSAWQSIRANGVVSRSHETRTAVEMFDRDSERNLKKIQKRLRDGVFAFDPQTGVLKRKASGGRRGIVMASVNNRVVERAWLDCLQGRSQYIKSVITQPTSVGGVPGRSVPHGLKLVRDAFESGKKVFIRSDISGFFDNIPRLDVIEKLAKEIDDPRFIDTLLAATAVTLKNEELLGEVRRVFPTNEEGVAQGSPLSPLFGNILLFDFDKKFNDRGVICVRFIDDFLLLAESETKVQKAFISAKTSLEALGLKCHDPCAQNANRDKASSGRAEDGFVFLGYHIQPGLFQPSQAARKNLLHALDEHLTFGRTVIEEVCEGQGEFASRQRYAQTLVLIDKVIKGWGNAFAYSSAPDRGESLDLQIDKKLDSFRNWFASKISGLDWCMRRRVGGVSLLTDIEKKDLDQVPFALNAAARFSRTKTTITISTDGSLATIVRKRGRDQGPGGWAFVVHETGEERTGSAAATTINQMELRAVVEAVRFADPSKPLIIQTDSQYVAGAVKNQAVVRTNISLWKEYHELCAGRKVKIVWVKGHSGDAFNDRADKLAGQAAESEKNGQLSQTVAAQRESISK